MKMYLCSRKCREFTICRPFFDTITCRIATHHFTSPAQFIYEVNRTLEDNGLFILIDNVSPENNEYDTFYNFIEKSVTQVMNEL